MIRFHVYPSYLIHYGTQIGGDVSVYMGRYRSLCGRVLIGYPTEQEGDADRVCKRCAKSFAHAQATYESLRERFGASS